MGENPYPRMRGVDMFPAEVSGQKVICLRDPLNLSGKILFLPIHTFFLVSLFDGEHSLVDVQEAFMRRFGELIYREKIEELISKLDENFLLESERFREAERQVMQSFKDSPVRPLALAGESYEEDGEALRKTITSFFSDPEGPGLSGPWPYPGEVTGAIAPHIDFRRGGPTYAWAHRALRESSPADLFLILGTAHSPMKKTFAFTRKDFQTPWGLVETDRNFLAGIQGAEDFFEDEWVHKIEHSIELQLVFLRALWKEENDFQVVPILCGSFQEAILKQCSPLEIPGVAPLLRSLKDALSRTEKKVCILASADLAHLGLRFGDAEPPNRFSLETLAEEDRRLLAYAERLEAEEFFRVISREKDRRRICGLAPIYVLLHLLEGTKGKLLKYSQSWDRASQSVVSFAGMAFYRDPGGQGGSLPE